MVITTSFGLAAMKSKFLDTNQQGSYVDAGSAHIQDIPLEKIVMSGNQARQRDTRVDEDDDLVRSIRKHGLISPVVVRPQDGKFELLIGQRRFHAHEILKKATIKAHVVDQNMSDDTANILSLVENVARKNMKEADMIDVIQIYMDKYGKTSIVAEELGLSIPTVRKYIKAGRLPKPIRDDTHNGFYTTANALKALNALGDDESAVDVKTLRETARHLQQLSPHSRDKFVSIQQKEPNSKPDEVAKKAKERTVIHKIKLTVTGDQLGKIDKYKKQERMQDVEEAALALVDLGLETVDV